MLVHAACAHHNQPAFPAFILPETDDFRARGERIADKDGRMKQPLRITQIGHRMARNIGHGFAENNMKDQPAIERHILKANGLGDRTRAKQWIAPAIKRLIKACVAACQRARHAMHNHVTEGEVLKITPVHHIPVPH